MKRYFTLLFLTFLLVAPVSAKDAENDVAANLEDFVHYQPEQIHLSVNDRGDSLTATWSTFDPTPKSQVEFGLGGPARDLGGPARLDRLAEGTADKFVDGGWLKRTQYIHRVTLHGLKPNSTYFYHVGSNLGWSDLFWFRTYPSFEGQAENWKPTFAVYGDLGNANAQSLPRLQVETQTGMYDAILHVGDFAYDMHSENALVGDEFMRQIEAIAAYVPYMTVPGNHEEKYNFSNYKNRFSMPNREETENMFYSFDVGPVHFVSVSTEFYYFINYGIKMVMNQYKWIIEDLKTANLPENRAKRPWIVFIGHRPMYCSTSRDKDCARKGTFTRVGFPLIHMYGLEKILLDFNVDLAIWAHAHSYERFFPIYDYKVMGGPNANDPYFQPRAPVHIITGSAGCEEKHPIWKHHQPKITAFRSNDYGYTRITAHNRTHLEIEQVSDDKDGAIIDRFFIVSHDHHFGRHHDEL